MLQLRFSRKNYATLLLVITLLFFLRVLGQVLVVFADVEFLPAMEHWYSGLMPYPLLLPVQLVMLVVMLRLVIDVKHGTGAFSRQSAKVGIFLRRFSYVYFLAMVIRYILTMAYNPELRWFGHTIPVIFHMVLALFLYTYGRYLTDSTIGSSAGNAAR